MIEPVTKLGVIAKRQINESGFPFEKLKCVQYHSEKNPFELYVAKIPFKNYKSARSLERKIKKAIKILEEQQVQKIIFSKPLKEYCKDLDVGSLQEERNRLFLEISPVCIRQVAAFCNINLLESEICIRDNNPGRIMECLSEASR